MAKKKKPDRSSNDRWKAENSKNYNIRLYRTTESDVIQRLESLTSKKDYIVQLIREDMRREDH